MDKKFITFAEYSAYEEKFLSGKNSNAWKSFGERERMEEKLHEMYKHLMPEVGMGATEILRSDIRAKTVVEVLTPNKIVVRENCTKCLDYYSGDYEILDELSNMRTQTFTRRKSGNWVEIGQPDRNGSVYLVLGFRLHYIDPSF